MLRSWIQTEEGQIMYTEKANKERSKQRQEEEGKGVCGRSIKERRDEIRVESER
jgi:hypothetical protein